MSQATAPANDEVTFLGHPVSLFVLFFAEFWERFSFYGMRALLVLYMIDSASSMNYTDGHAFAVYGAYGAMVYATPVIGGLLADRYLGYRKSVIFGGVLMALGHFAMAIEDEMFFYGALALLIAGNGFFKPNISSLVGKLYGEDDPRRDSAFTIFYMGINAGAMVAPIACAQIASSYATRDASGEIIQKAWHYGFGLAGVGMVFGLITFILFQKHLGEHGFAPIDSEGNPPAKAIEWGIYAAPFIALPVIMWLLNNEPILDAVLNAVGLGVLAYLIYAAVISDLVERQRMFVLITLMFFSLMFWTFFEQAGSSISVFTARNVDRTLFGTEVEAASFQAVNPAFILLFAPIFAALWTRLGRMHRDPSAPVKFGFGIIQLGLGFAALWYGATQAEAGITSVSWLIIGYLFHTTGELCLSPVGLSMVTKLAPARMVGLVMGAWFLATSFSHMLAAKIAQMTGSGGSHDGEADPAVGYGPTVQLEANLSTQWEVKPSVKEVEEPGNVDLVATIQVNGDTPGQLNATWSQGGTILVTESISLPAKAKSLSLTTSGAFIGCTADCPVLSVVSTSGDVSLHSSVKTVLNATDSALPDAQASTEMVWNPPETLALYTPVFGNIAIVATLVGLLCLALSPILTKWMHIDEGASTPQPSTH